MLSVVLPVMLAIIGIAAGWLNCFQKGGESGVRFYRRIRPQGWIVLALIMLITVSIGVVSTRADKARNLAVTSASDKLERLRLTHIRNFQTDYTIRSWRENALADINEYRFRINAYFMRMTGASFYFAGVRDLRDSRESIRDDSDLTASLDSQINQIRKRLKDVFHDALEDGVDSLGLIADAIPVTLRARNVPWTTSHRKRTKAILEIVEASRSFEGSVSTPNMAHALVASLRASSELILGMAESAIEKEYVHKLTNATLTGIAKPVSRRVPEGKE